MAASTLYIILLSDKAFIYFSKLSLVECERHAVPSGEACYSPRRPAAPRRASPTGCEGGPGAGWLRCCLLGLCLPGRVIPSTKVDAFTYCEDDLYTVYCFPHLRRLGGGGRTWQGHTREGSAGPRQEARVASSQ